MDIWDSLRLVRRHWRFTVPVAVGGLLLSLVLYALGSTSWSVRTQVMLLGPSQSVVEVDGVLRVDELNPLFEAGLAMPLTRVIVFSMQDDDVRAGLEAEGLSSDYKLEFENRQPLITTTVTADSPEIATETAQRLFDLVTVELIDRQEEAGAPEFERATQALLAISDPKENFRIPRLFFGAGMALTLAATVGMGFGVEWRRRRGEYDDELEYETEYVERVPARRTVRAVPDVAVETVRETATPEAPPEPAVARSDDDDPPTSRWGRREAN